MLRRASLSCCLLLEPGTPEKITTTIPFGCWNSLSSVLSSSFFLLSSSLSLFFPFHAYRSIKIRQSPIVWFPCECHIQCIFSMSSNLLNFEIFFVLSTMATVLSGPCFLSGCPMFGKFLLSEFSVVFSVVFVRKSFPHLFFSHNHFSTARLNSSLFLGFSLQKS
jgi:hypothetical protein